VGPREGLKASIYTYGTSIDSGPYLAVCRIKFEVEETDPATQWIGRRSFGGFNPTVQKMWEQNCEKAGLFKGRKRRSDEISDEEMVKRLQDMGKVPERGGGGGKRGRYTDLGAEDDRKGGGGQRQGQGQGRDWQGQGRGGQGQGKGGQGQGRGGGQGQGRNNRR
jgi:hypothetical protein